MQKPARRIDRLDQIADCPAGQSACHLRAHGSRMQADDRDAALRNQRARQIPSMLAAAFDIDSRKALP